MAAIPSLIALICALFTLTVATTGISLAAHSARVQHSRAHHSLVYAADFTHRYSGWSSYLGGTWTIGGGVMSFDGNSEAGTTIAPLTMPPGRSFAIVARIRFETEQGSCPSFGLLVRSHVPLSTRDNLGVLGTVQTGSYDWCPHGLGISYVSPFWDGERTSFNNFAWADFQPGSSWHTYRLEVRGARLQFLVDHQLLASGLSNAYYYSGRIGVFAGNAAIMVRSFRVYTLP